LTQDLVVFGVAPDPEPKQPVLNFDGECSIVEADSDRPEFSNLLEVEPRVRGISLEQGIARVCYLLYLLGKTVVAGPEVR